jgi:hypothetical protein
MIFYETSEIVVVVILILFESSFQLLFDYPVLDL